MHNPRPARSGISRRPLLGSSLLLALAAGCGEPPQQGGGGGNGGNGDGGEGEAGIAEGEPAFVWAVPGSDRESHKAVAQLWNETHPNKQVEIFFLAPTADEQRQAMFQDLQTQAGEFDVLSLDVIWTGEFAESDYIESMEQHRAEVQGTMPSALETAQWQGELWALPYSSNAGFLYYRTDLVDTPPKTWPELMQVGLSAAEEANIEAYVGQGDQYEGFVVNYLELFWSAGGNLFNPEQTESTFLDGDAAREALDYMSRATNQGFYADGFASMVEDDARALFQAGDAVFMRNWPYAYRLLENNADSEVVDKFDIAPLPTFDGSGTISALGGLNNAVSTLSDNADVATEFVVWAATNEEAQTILAEQSLAPTMTSVYDKFGDDPTISLLGEVLEFARARPPVPGYNSFSLAVQDNLHPAYRGQDNADQELEAVDQAAVEALK